MNRTFISTIPFTYVGVMTVVFSIAAVSCVAQQGGNIGTPSGEVPSPNSPRTDVLQDAEPSKPKCPPDSWTYTNASSGAVTVFYSCEGNSGGATTVPAGGSVTFKEDCGIGPDAEPNCISCGLLSLDDPGGRRFECQMQNAYSDAYGIDLAAIGFTLTDKTLELFKKVYDADGNPIRLRYYSIPVIDEDGTFAKWEFTTIKPNFSVEDGEVVIRDNRQRVIGDRTGITLEK